MKIQHLIPILFLAAFCTVSAQTNNAPTKTTVTASLALGQLNFTNVVSPTAAIMIVSQLKVGMREEEARNVLATNGLRISSSYGGTVMWDDCCELSNGKVLQLGYTAKDATNVLERIAYGNRGGQLNYAIIRGKVGEDDVLINLSNAPINVLGVPGGVAEIYHLDVDNPSAEDRARLARDFLKFTPENQCRVLNKLWPRVRCPELTAVLLPLATPAIESERGHPNIVRDEVFIRLLEIKPEAVRPLILSDLRSGLPILPLRVLVALPDKELPELDNVLLANMGDSYALDINAPLFERYATARILPQVLAFYDQKQGRWACRLQTAILRYCLKHDRSAALQAIERAVNSRSSTGCYKWVLSQTLHDSFDAEAEKLVNKYVNDPDPEVAADAKQLLSRHTSADAPELKHL